MARILIVDNDPQLRLLYELELHQMGYDTITCASGTECLRDLLQEKPDLVVLDIQMPGPDGLEILQSIRSTQPALPVILNTGYARYRDNYLTYPADRCVIKSSDTTELFSAIEDLLPKRRSVSKTRRNRCQQQFGESLQM
jgi:CheY-like chemotaxis protein